jgi:hypothetical protein
MDLLKKPKPEDKKDDVPSPVDRRLEQTANTTPKEPVDKEKAKKFMAGFKGTV